MRRVFVVLALALGLLAPTLPSAQAASQLGGDYVALGDSYTSGAAIPKQFVASGMCLRSNNNYPHLIARKIGATWFHDASCSGARTKDMTRTQHFPTGPSNPPQFNRLNRNTRLVTLGISANDVGFVEIIENCHSATPTGHPCRNKYVVHGHDFLRDRIAYTRLKVAAALRGIKARSPKARIFVVGYPAIFPDTGNGCWPRMPLAPDDVRYLRGIEKASNSMLATTAAANHARYVDTYTPSVRHNACQPLAINRWIEPVVPNRPAAPVHPNAAGQRAIANLVLAALRRSS